MFLLQSLIGATGRFVWDWLLHVQQHSCISNLLHESFILRLFMWILHIFFHFDFLRINIWIQNIFLFISGYSLTDSPDCVREWNSTYSIYNSKRPQARIKIINKNKIRKFWKNRFGKDSTEIMKKWTPLTPSSRPLSVKVYVPRSIKGPDKVV